MNRYDLYFQNVIIEKIDTGYFELINRIYYGFRIMKICCIC